MPNIEFSSLSVNGHAQASIPNHFLRQVGESQTLAVLFPGLNYSCDKPLLYYTTGSLIEHSCDVLQLWANYTAAEFQSLSKQNQLHWLEEDALALIHAGLAQRNYDRLLLVGKSIGTLTLGALLSHSDTFLDAHAIWFTPLIHYTVVPQGMSRARKKCLYVAGTADRAFDPHFSVLAQGDVSHQALIVEGADHSLQIPNDLPRSLDVLKQIVITTNAFIDGIQ